MRDDPGMRLQKNSSRAGKCNVGKCNVTTISSSSFDKAWRSFLQARKGLEASQQYKLHVSSKDGERGSEVDNNSESHANTLG